MVLNTLHMTYNIVKYWSSFRRPINDMCEIIPIYFNLSHFSLFCLFGRLFFMVPYFPWCPIFWCPIFLGALFSWCPIFLVPYFPGALFSKVPYFLGCPIFWCPIFWCPIFWCPIFPPPLSVEVCWSIKPFFKHTLYDSSLGVYMSIKLLRKSKILWYEKEIKTCINKGLDIYN